MNLTPFEIETVEPPGEVTMVTVTVTGTSTVWFTTDGSRPRMNSRRSYRAAQGTRTVVTDEPIVAVKLVASAPATAHVVFPGAGPTLPVFDEVMFRAPDGTVRRISIDDDGALITEEVVAE